MSLSSSDSEGSGARQWDGGSDFSDGGDLLDDGEVWDHDEMRGNEDEDEYHREWDNEYFHYWRDDAAEGIALFDNTPLVTLAATGAPRSDEEAADRFNPTRDGDMEMDCMADAGSGDQEWVCPISLLAHLLAACTARDAARLSSLVAAYVQVDPASTPFLEHYYTAEPQWGVLEAFFQLRRDYYLRHGKGRALKVKPSAMAQSEGLVCVSPIGLLTNSELNQRLRGVAGVVKAAVAYVNGCPQGFAALQLENEEAVAALQHHLAGLSLDGLSPVLCRALPLDDPQRRGLFNETLLKSSQQPTAGVSVAHVTPLVSKKTTKRLAREKQLEDLCGRLRSGQVDELPFVAIDFEAAVTGSTYALPTEVAIVSYTLRKGRREAYHAFIHPGLLPLELQPTAIGVCVSHPPTGIPFRNFCLARTDYAVLWAEISARLPADAIVVAKGPKVEVDCLAWLAARANAAPCAVVVHELTDVFTAFATLCGRTLDAAELVCLGRLNQQFLFDDTRCEYHDWLAHVTADAPEDYHCAARDAFSLCFALNAVVEVEFPGLRGPRPLKVQRPAIGTETTANE